MNQRLGKDIFENHLMGIGAWAWGDRFVWGYGKGYSLADLREVFEISIRSGITFFDTAEVYGQGESENILGQFLETAQQKVFIATKFMPFPWRLSRQALINALKGSLRRLRLQQVDLYQIHQPLPPVNIETWMEGLIEAVQQGMTRAVGVSNYDVDQMQRAYDRLIKDGINLASNQVEYHLLNRKIERNGLLQRANELGVKIIAYSPLAMGVLTGKYSPESPPSGIRGARYNSRVLRKIQPLINLLRDIGEVHHKTPAQVALNWVICKGALPIPGAKTRGQAEQNAGALHWKLSEEEMLMLDEMSERVVQE